MPAGWVPRANYPTYVWFWANLVLPLICEADEVLQLLGCSSLAQAVESVRALAGSDLLSAFDQVRGGAQGAAKALPG